MDSLDIHEVVDIKTFKGSHAPFQWRVIVVTNSEGKQFEITLYGKEENLTIKEDHHE